MYIYTEADDIAMKIETAVNQALKKHKLSSEVDKESGYDPVTHTTAKQRAAASDEGICMNIFGEYVCVNRGDTK